MKKLITFSLMFIAASCLMAQEYVVPKIPKSLKKNKDAVKLLERNIEDLNNMIESWADFGSSIEEVGNMIVELDLTKTEKEVEAQIEQIGMRYGELTMSSMTKMMSSMLSLTLKSKGLEKYATTLPEKQQAAFLETVKTFKLNETLIKTQLQDYAKRLEELNTKFEAREAEFEAYFKTKKN